MRKPFAFALILTALICVAAAVPLAMRAVAEHFPIGGYLYTDASRWKIDGLGAQNEGDSGPIRLRTSGDVSTAWANSSRGTASIRVSDIPVEPQNYWHVIHYGSTLNGYNRIIRATVADLDAPIPSTTGSDPVVVTGGLGWSTEQANEAAAPNFVFPGAPGWRTLTTNKMENRAIMVQCRIQVHMPEGVEPAANDVLHYYLRQGGFKSGSGYLKVQMDQIIESPLTSSYGFGFPPGFPPEAIVVVEII